jgi:nitroreductase
MDAYDAILRKRDQRAFLPTPISEEGLRRILQAGRMTGSSKNREPNRFVVVRSREGVAALGALSPFGRWMARAPVAIAIVQTEGHAFDAGRCAQNMMLAAWSQGIGSCPAHLPEPEVARVLGIPEGLAINRVIGFGYVDPARAAPPAAVARPRRPLAELVHDERW